jgi:hypothetical protein
MKSSLYSYPFDKVMRTTKGALRHMGLRITRFDKFSGQITAESGFSILNPSLHVNLHIEETASHDIRVTVSGHSKRRFFLQRHSDDETREAAILEKLSVLL